MNQPVRPDTIAGRREAREQRAREQSNDAINDIRFLMQSAQGRRFMRRLMTRCGTDESTFTGNSDGYRLEGRRQVGLETLEEVKAHAFDEYLMMLKEQRIDGN